MSLINDPIGDMLTRIRNGHMRNKEQVVCPHSNLRVAVLKVLKGHGYISDYAVEEQLPGKFVIKIDLKYYDMKPVIKYIERVSKPGRHLYVKCKDLEKCYNGLGIVVLSTSAGVMSDHRARKENVGGEILCRVF